MKRVILAGMMALAGANAYADDHTEAKGVCQEFARKHLKAPSTAKLEPLSTVAAAPSHDKKWSKLRNVWESIGWVDSQNSYGAMLRTEYSCTAQKNGNTWKVLDMYFFAPGKGPSNL